MNIHKTLPITIYEAIDLHYMLKEYIDLLEEHQQDLIKKAPTTDEWILKINAYVEGTNRRIGNTKEMMVKLEKLYNE